MQTRNPILDDMAKLATSAAGMAQGVGEEMRAMWRSQMERIVADMDLVSRDEFEAVKEVAAKARQEAAALREELLAIKADQSNKAARPSRKKTGSVE